MLNGIEVMRSRVIGGLWVMGLSVNYPDAMVVPEQAALWASEDLSHHLLCHLSHAGMVRLPSMVLLYQLSNNLFVPHVLQASSRGDRFHAL